MVPGFFLALTLALTLIYFRRESTQSAPSRPCLLYTSDAADERSSVDLGGRGIIKKKKIEDKLRPRILYKKQEQTGDENTDKKKSGIER